METSSFKQEKHAEGQNNNIKAMSILYISFMVEKKSICIWWMSFFVAHTHLHIKAVAS